MIRLVVNGDDFGMTASISQGIVRAYRDGILTSCSILGNCEAFGTHVALLQAAPGIGVGIHLALVGGRPVLPPSCIRGGSTLNRGHEHQRSIRCCSAREGRPRRFGGTQRDSGTRNDNSSCIVQQWSVIPAAMAGVLCRV
jgi:YdjC-like protein